MATLFIVLDWFSDFIHLLSWIALSAAAFGLIRLAPKPGLSKLKIAGYGLGAIAITSLLGGFFNLIMTGPLASTLGYEGLRMWHFGRSIIGGGIDVLGFGAVAYGLFAAAKE